MGDFHNGFLYHFELSRERTELDLTGTLEDKIADNMKELKKIFLDKGLAELLISKLVLMGTFIFSHSIREATTVLVCCLNMKLIICLEGSCSD